MVIPMGKPSFLRLRFAPASPRMSRSAHPRARRAERLPSRADAFGREGRSDRSVVRSRQRCPRRRTPRYSRSDARSSRPARDSWLPRALDRHHRAKSCIDVSSAPQQAGDKSRQGDAQQARADSVEDLHRNQCPWRLPASGDQPAQGQGRQGGNDQRPVPVPAGVPSGPKRRGNHDQLCHDDDRCREGAGVPSPRVTIDCANRGSIAALPRWNSSMVIASRPSSRESVSTRRMDGAGLRPCSGCSGCLDAGPPPRARS